jgi:hypothetical protein
LQRTDAHPLGSDRSFGFVFAAVFTVIAIWPLMDGAEVRWWGLAIAAVFLGVALIRPALLRPLNRAWMAFGRVLHAIVSPVVMAFLFYIVVTPIAAIMRLLHKVPLKLSFDPAAPSYWIERRPPGPAPDSLKNQF